MVLQTSGAISLADIQTEFGGSNPIGLNEYYDAASGIPASGSIDFADFYGASASNDIVYDNIASGGAMREQYPIEKIQGGDLYLLLTDSASVNLFPQLYTSAAVFAATSLKLSMLSGPILQMQFSTDAIDILSEASLNTRNPNWLGIKVEIGYTSSFEIGTRTYTTPFSSTVIDYAGKLLTLRFQDFNNIDPIYSPWNNIGTAPIDPATGNALWSSTVYGKYLRWTFLFA